MSMFDVSIYISCINLLSNTNMNVLLSTVIFWLESSCSLAEAKAKAGDDHGAER
jgi:hypothetical protein